MIQRVSVGRWTPFIHSFSGSIITVHSNFPGKQRPCWSGRLLKKMLHLIFSSTLPTLLYSSLWVGGERGEYLIQPPCWLVWVSEVHSINDIQGYIGTTNSIQIHLSTKFKLFSQTLWSKNLQNPEHLSMLKIGGNLRIFTFIEFKFLYIDTCIYLFVFVSEIGYNLLQHWTRSWNFFLFETFFYFDLCNVHSCYVTCVLL